MKKEFHKSAVVMLILLLVIGCTSGFQARHSAALAITNEDSLDLIQKDLLYLVFQILDPQNTTVQHSVPETVFGEKIIRSLRENGYGMQRVSADQGAQFLTYDGKVASTAGTSIQFLYTIAIGDISVERTYIDLGDPGIHPFSPVVVRGSNVQAELNKALFNISTEDADYITQVEYQSPDYTSLSVPRISVVTTQLVAEIAAGENLLPEKTARNTANLETNNLFFTNESNFSATTRSYQTIRRDIIVFANDSIRLGLDGKRKVREIYKTYSPKTDVISLLGCSNGKTDLAIGNQGLALGRSKRVVQEFNTIGVPRSGLLDEGCWSPERLDGRFPRRGVVVELKRRRS